jgi:hypothetical protein
MFIPVFTIAFHLFLSWAISTQSTRSNFVKICRNITTLTMPSTVRPSKWSLTITLPHQNSACNCRPPHAHHMPRPSLTRLNLITRIIIDEECDRKARHYAVFTNRMLIPVPRARCLPQHPILEHPEPCSSLNVRVKVWQSHKTTHEILLLYFLYLYALDRKWNNRNFWIERRKTYFMTRCQDFSAHFMTFRCRTCTSIRQTVFLWQSAVERVQVSVRLYFCDHLL